MSIRLDPKHGVNPSVQVCFFCGEDAGVVLFGALHRETRRAFQEQGFSEDGEAPRSVVIPGGACTKCEELLQERVLFVEVESEEKTTRTGRCAWVRRTVVEDMITEPMASTILEGGMCYLDVNTWSQLFGAETATVPA